jgi:hypothetical protein
MLLIKLTLVCYVQMIPPSPPSPPPHPPYPFPHLEQAQRIKLMYKKISWDWTHTGTALKHGHLKKINKCSFFLSFFLVSVGLLFVSVQSKHRNSLFRYRSETTETNILFRIVPKLVSVLVSVVSNRN